MLGSRWLELLCYLLILRKEKEGNRNRIFAELRTLLSVSAPSRGALREPQHVTRAFPRTVRPPRRVGCLGRQGQVAVPG